ncbi:hypothetical protein ID866_4949 [Astraeus odoratus]|nr:hypothetical protein ID866_4949 [Astraeus odoratus]
MKACRPATFGLNNEDVYDESYRKARKMDLVDFTTSFDVENVGIIDILRRELLAKEREKPIRVEMYKLNVYDSFFKAHKDTPRHETMFRSLVVVFPTPHEGGEFAKVIPNAG